MKNYRVSYTLQNILGTFNSPGNPFESAHAAHQERDRVFKETPDIQTVWIMAELVFDGHVIRCWKHGYSLRRERALS